VQTGTVHILSVVQWNLKLVGRSMFIKCDNIKTWNPLYKLVFDGKIVGSTSYHCNSIDFMFEKSKAKEGPSDGQLVC
jgi:hypothetical protein